MGARGADLRFLRRLEPTLSAIAADREPLRLAFSGGIASIVLAALVRKRADLECVVAALPGAPDLLMAAEERLFLDYRVTEVRLTAVKALAMARGLARRFPALSVREVLDAVPLEAARAQNPRGPILAGLGAHPVPAATAEAFSRLGFDLPLLPETRSAGSPRPRLVAVARSLGIPEAFVLSPPRPPGLGSGVGPALRAVSLEKRTTVGRLLRS